MENLRNNLEKSLELKEVFVDNSIQRVFVSRVGKVYSITNKYGIRELRPLTNQAGYQFISISDRDKYNQKEKIFNKSYYVQRLVLAAFQYDGDYSKLKGMDVDHIDGNNQNNSIHNLELVTHKENCRRARERRKILEMN